MTCAFDVHVGQGVLALGQEKFESAKLHWAAALASGSDLKTWDSSGTLELYQTAEEQMRTASEVSSYLVAFLLAV